MNVFPIHFESDIECVYVFGRFNRSTYLQFSDSNGKLMADMDVSGIFYYIENSTISLAI